MLRSYTHVPCPGDFTSQTEIHIRYPGYSYRKLNITCLNTKKDVYHSQLTHTPIFFTDDFPTPDSNVTLGDYACVKSANVMKSWD